MEGGRILILKSQKSRKDARTDILEVWRIIFACSSYIVETNCIISPGTKEVEQ